MNKMAEKNDQKMRERAERAEKFQAKLQELLALAKKKKNMLEYQEINDHFKDFALSPEQIDKILDFLEANHVDVLRITDDDDDILIDDEDHPAIPYKYSPVTVAPPHPVLQKSRVRAPVRHYDTDPVQGSRL